MRAGNNPHGPDGVVELRDILGVLDAFAGDPPTRYTIHNFDIMGFNDVENEVECKTDGIVDLSDIIAVLDAFAGNPACICGAAPLASPSPPPPPADDRPRIDLVVESSPMEAQGDFFVDVYTSEFEDLRGYELVLELMGPRADDLQLIDIYIDPSKTGYPFTNTYHSAVDVPNRRMVSVQGTGGVTSQLKSYLGTYVYSILASAPAHFVVRVQPTADTMLVDSYGRRKTLGPVSSGILAR